MGPHLAELKVGDEHTVVPWSTLKTAAAFYRISQIPIT